MLNVLYGDDSFSLHQAMSQLKADLDGDGMLDSNTTVFDGQKVTFEELISVCSTVPFLANYRLVIVEGLLHRFQVRRGSNKPSDSDKQKGKEDLGSWATLPDALSAMPKSTTLVIVDGEIGADNVLLKSLRSVSKVRHFRPPGFKALPAWIQRRADDAGLSLTPRAVHLLARLVGRDTWVLASEIDKLATYANGRRLEEADLQELVSSAPEVSVFSLIDAIVEGKAALAAKRLRQIIGRDADSRYVFNMIVRQYRNLVMTREFLEASVSQAEIGSRLGVRSQFALEKLTEQARSSNWAVLRSAYFKLVSADAAVKRGVHSDDLSLTLLVHDLATSSR